MAEGIDRKVKNLQDLEEDVTCAVCQEHYTEPKVLPCLHYYCKKCVLSLAFRRGTNQPFSCPECRKETILPDGGVDELKTAFFVHRLESMYSTEEQVHGRVEIKCEGCTDSEDKAEAFCHQCSVFICKECIKQHKRMKAFASHQVDSLEDLKRDGVKQLAKQSINERCLIHEEPLMMYCLDCACFVCRDCTATAHRDHKFDFNKVIVPATKRKLQEELNPLRIMKASLSRALEEVQTTKQEVKVQVKYVNNIIYTSFDELHKILENHQQQLLNKAERVVQVKVDKLSAQEKKLSLANTEVQGIIDCTERLLQLSSDSEVMSMHDELSSQIKHEIEEHGKADWIMEPVEEADMGVEVRCAEALQQLCQEQTKITQLLIVKKVELAIDNEVNVSSEAILTLWGSKGEKGRLDIKTFVKSLCNGSAFKGTVNQTSPNKYSVRYTPTLRGRHELIVAVDGQHIAGSPFPMFVSIHPAQLGKPVKMWKDLPLPCGVAINSVDEIIVAEVKGNVIKLDKNRRKQVLVDESEIPLEAMCDVAVDSDDNIYAVDYVTAKILKCNREGGDIEVHDIKQVKGRGYWAVMIIGGEVMVTERNNIGTIMVYDRSLKYMRRIEHEDKGEFRKVDVDSQGNLYVADWTRHCVHVLNSGGSFLHSFGCRLPKSEMQRRPAYLCVASPYVYVCDHVESTDVSIFTTAGDHVTMFGHYGKGKNNLNVPCGVCVDSNGFLFVADIFNSRLLCF